MTADNSKKESTLVTRAVSTWSLHRTLGRFVADDSAAHGGPFIKAPPSANGLSLLDLPAELRNRGYDAVQICHFHLPSRSPAYLEELRAALAASGIELDALLVDDGDLSDPESADRDESWIGAWLDVATALGARRARVGAGKQAPTAAKLKDSGQRLGRLAAGHPEVRVVTENWLGMTPDASSVHTVLAAAGENVGLLIDLGNWRSADKYEWLAAIAPLAETCHAKCHFTETGPDREDFRASLQILKDAGFDGPLALIYDGADDDEWACLDTEYGIAREVFAFNP
jgi:sugar phosphate isomerase/epimerase